MKTCLQIYQARLSTSYIQCLIFNATSEAMALIKLKSCVGYLRGFLDGYLYYGNKYIIKNEFSMNQKNSYRYIEN